MGFVVYFLMIMLLILLTINDVNSDLAKDRELCADQIIGLACMSSLREWRRQVSNVGMLHWFENITN